MNRGHVVLLCSFLLACGGGAKPQPLVPEPAPGEENGSSETSLDAGAPGDDSETAQVAMPPLPPPAPTTSSDAGALPAAPPTGDEEGARTLLGQFVVPNADYAALTRALRPTTSDYKALFDAKTAPKIEASQAKDWDSNKAVIKPKPSQTEVKLWSATGTELQKGTGNAKEFPGDYSKVAKHLVPTAVYYRFKFVEPGKDTGTAYDGLSFVHGHWVIVPKPWRAFEKHTDDSDDKPVKKKPKKKKA